MPAATDKRSAPAIRHLDGCPAEADRAETFTTAGPRGSFTITRCQDCGQQLVERTGGPATPAEDEPS